MKTFCKYIIYFAIYIKSIVVIYAYDVRTPSGLLPGINYDDPWYPIASIISWLIGITAVLTIVAVTIAAIQMILAVGEEEKMKKARHTMIYSFIGLIVAWLAYSVVQLITNLKLDNF